MKNETRETIIIRDEENALRFLFPSGNNIYYCELDDFNERDWFKVTKLVSKYLKLAEGDDETSLYDNLLEIKTLILNQAPTFKVTSRDKFKVNERGNKHLRAINKAKDDIDYNELVSDSDKDMLILPFLTLDHISNSSKIFNIIDEYKHFKYDFSIWVTIVFYLRIKIEALKSELVKK